MEIPISLSLFIEFNPTVAVNIIVKKKYLHFHCLVEES